MQIAKHFFDDAFLEMWLRSGFDARLEGRTDKGLGFWGRFEPFC
jgi:hypothetical protein